MIFQLSLKNCSLVSCRIRRGIELQAVGMEMEKARSASLVRVLGKEQVWVLLLKERRQLDELAVG